MHTPVLLEEIVTGLGLERFEVSGTGKTNGKGSNQGRGIVIDCTLNAGGHAKAILERYEDVSVIGIDADPEAIERAAAVQKKFPGRLFIYHSNFARVTDVVSEHGDGKIIGAFMDLGVSSQQLDGDARGFSFKGAHKLDMRFDPTRQTFTASDLLNYGKQEDLVTIIRNYGEERYAGRIARHIAEARVIAPIETTEQLAEIIMAAVPAAYKRMKIHPATRTFQAVRIAVNDELGNLQRGLDEVWKTCAPGARLAVISFHSLEDRIVKQTMRGMVSAGQGTLINKKVMTASRTETGDNPRSRSAKLRIIEKI